MKVVMFLVDSQIIYDPETHRKMNKAQQFNEECEVPNQTKARALSFSEEASAQ